MKTIDGLRGNRSMRRDQKKIPFLELQAASPFLEPLLSVQLNSVTIH